MLKSEWAQVEVIDLVNDGSGLAFGIVGSRNTGVVVKSILPGGIADRDNRLRSGDHILQIGGINLKGLGSDQVASILRQCGVHVRIMVARSIQKSSQDEQKLNRNATIVPSKLIENPEELKQYLTKKGYEKFYNSTTATKNNGLQNITTSTKNVPTISLKSCNNSKDVVSNSVIPQTEYFSVRLKKSEVGFGIIAASYVCEKEDISGVFVKSITNKGSSAVASYLTDKIKINDRIIKVDDISLIGLSNRKAIKILKKTNRITTLSFERFLKGPKYEQLQRVIKSNESFHLSSKSLLQKMEKENEISYFEVFEEIINDDLYDHSINNIVEACQQEEDDLSYKSAIDNNNGSERQKINQEVENLCFNDKKFSKTSKMVEISKEEKIINISTNKIRPNDLQVEVSPTRRLEKGASDVFSGSDRLLSSFSPNREESSDKDCYDTCIDNSITEEIINVDEKITSSVELNYDFDNESSSNNLIFKSSLKSVRSDPGLRLQKIKNENVQINLNPNKKFFQLAPSNDVKNNYVNTSESHITTFCKSEPILNNLNLFNNETNTKKKFIKINEYYNDYADCLDAYSINSNENKENTLTITTNTFNNGEIEVRKSLNNVIYNNNFNFSESANLLTVQHRFKSASFTNNYHNNNNYYNNNNDNDNKTDSCQRRYSFELLNRDQILIIGESTFNNTTIRQQDVLISRQTFIPESNDADFFKTKSVNPLLMKGKSEKMLEKHWGTKRHVKVHRDNNQSLGISIVGGKVDLNNSQDMSHSSVMGIFIKNVVPNSPAGKTGEFKTGDRILEVSGIDLRRASHEKAIQAIKNASNPITFTLQSLVSWNDHDGKNRNNNDLFNNNNNNNNTESNKEDGKKSVRYKDRTNEEINNVRKSLKKIAVGSVKNKNLTLNSSMKNKAKNTNNVVVFNDAESNNKVTAESSSDSDDDEEDVRELEGRTVSAKGQEIDRASAANVKRTKEEAVADEEEEDDFGYTCKKISKKYNNLGHSVMMVKVEKGQQGLGLSLAGHKNRNRMAVFVCGLNPTGAAYRTGDIHVGDEILEVNGVVLHGRCHLNASAIIKGLSGPIFKIVVLRRKEAVEELAVRPITQFPITLDDETPEEKYANFPNLRIISIKKGNQSLGIMIIEGKHAEVGQGIFISDIQEGSAAEKAGLEIGEMILAVNKDSLVGSSYNDAAALLKQSEGVVTLVVSNPSKKAGDDSKTEESKQGKAATPEPPADPATCPIKPGKDTTIEINAENKGLGLFFVGGTDTPIINGFIIVDVYKGGSAAKDARLQPGDQILDVNGTPMKELTHLSAKQILRQIHPKVKLIVYRTETPQYTPVEVEITKKPGKGLGLSVSALENNKGVYVTDIICGGLADTDGKIAKGDVISSINDHNVENASPEEAGAILKGTLGKIILKLNRYKPKA